MMRYWLPVLAAALAGVFVTPDTALALNPQDATNIDQSVTVTPGPPIAELTRENGRVIVLNRDQCMRAFGEQQPFTFRFNFNSTVLTGGLADLEGPYILAVAEEETSAACDEENPGGCIDVEDVEGMSINAPDGSVQKEFKIDFDDLVGNTKGASDSVTILNVAQDCLASGGEGFHNQYFIRYLIEDNSGTDRVMRISDAVLEVDALAAPQPSSLDGLSATDERVFVEWTQTERSEVDAYVAFVAKTDVSGSTLAQLENNGDVVQETISTDNPDPEEGKFSGSVKVGELELSAGDRVWVGIATEDDVENLSQPLFFEDSVEVVEVLDFWETYKGAGGSQSGCTTTGDDPVSAAIIACALLGFIAVRRRL
ncbi:MAG: hypothetical protein ACQEVA_11475 [Myxococcota bacterium]